uniref:small ribosomal subunit protein mS31 n=1 Tax=Myxine glutinosa TaxID=7769 RepID=UPI00358E73D4
MAAPVLVLRCIRSVKQRVRWTVCARGFVSSGGDGEEDRAGGSGRRSSNHGADSTPLDGAESFAGSTNAARSSSKSKAKLASLLNSMRIAENDGGTHPMVSQRKVKESRRKAEGSRGRRSEHEVRSAKLVAAVTKVAHSLPGKPSETESILLKQLRQHETHAETERRKITPNLRQYFHPHVAVPEPTLWDVEKERVLAAIQEHRQQHSLDELIEWTSKGILWTFPIDNEQGLEEDQKVPFHEHIFLEHELEHFPKKGPIRHFMQLVLLGLSNNHALTVAQKREHVAWYRDYFQQKEELLRESGTPI